MWAVYVEHLFPDHFYLMDSVWYIAMLIVGGMGTITGAILGTVFLLTLSELTVVYGPLFTKMLPLKFGASAGASLGSLVFAILLGAEIGLYTLKNTGFFQTTPGLVVLLMGLIIPIGTLLLLIKIGGRL